MPKPSDYFLSDSDNAAIFEQQIRPAEFGDGHGDDGGPAASLSSPHDQDRRPVCIILAGQTGAGKSHAAPALAAALGKLTTSPSVSGGTLGTVGSGGPAPGSPACYCHLVADTHKPYHPAYAGLVADAAAGLVPPGLASAATGHDARRWLARACAVAASRSLPTLVESASRYPQDVVDMAGIFHRHNYRVCLVLLAVHPVQSRLGLLARFLDAKSAGPPVSHAPEQASQQASQPTTAKKTLPVRLTPRLVHDESYAGLAELATLLDVQGAPSPPPLSDAVLILRRGNQVAYTNYWTTDGGEDKERRWRKTPAGVGVALATEREKRQSSTAGLSESSPLAAEAALFASDVTRLREAHPERADELDALASEYARGTPVEADDGNHTSYHLLDPDALVALLQAAW
ncbi:zeta toxin [Sporothrix brasiliensis 5110]|uniref:Zeta toxin n=1 Tax=Sporothrix brasiliensis 5110 TaxID=1398154 RepID=A0A0C2IJQ4_9PEZI|nr:zeta toxin [Sporothrix brasiliensis 5110]KIH89401.1 zeta toxin [Sporothrix brasiliensis 5110]